MDPRGDLMKSLTYKRKIGHGRKLRRRNFGKRKGDRGSAVRQRAKNWKNQKEKIKNEKHWGVLGFS
jgi:hypothetical protein